MKPTAKLRFVERVVPTPEYGENTGKIVRILQQWWEHTEWNAPGEWRDVQLEKENE
jgi:hypothetical protein